MLKTFVQVNIFVETVIGFFFFFRILQKIESSNEQYLFEIAYLSK